MKKLWTFISVFLLGVIGGLVTMYYMAGDQVSVTVRKIKNKGTSGDNSVIIPIEVESGRTPEKPTRKERKAKKDIAKSEKKKAKIAKRLTKKL